MPSPEKSLKQIEKEDKNKLVNVEENGVYSIDKQKMEELSDQLLKNVTLYFSPVVACYNYDFRVADDTIKNADILVSKTKIDPADTSKCAVVNVVYMDNNSIAKVILDKNEAHYHSLHLFI